MARKKAKFNDQPVTPPDVGEAYSSSTKLARPMLPSHPQPYGPTEEYAYNDFLGFPQGIERVRKPQGRGTRGRFGPSRTTRPSIEQPR